MEPITIRKYPNRRLYDTSRSRYVNLEEIAAMVREGKTVRVTDAKTGEDLTPAVLTEVIFEEARGQKGTLPQELLHEMIRAPARTAEEFFTFWTRSVQVFRSGAEETLKSAFRPWLAVSSLWPGLEWFQAADPKQEEPGEPAAREHQELERLRQEVRELRASVRKLKAGGKRESPVRKARVSK